MKAVFRIVPNSNCLRLQEGINVNVALIYETVADCFSILFNSAKCFLAEFIWFNLQQKPVWTHIIAGLRPVSIKISSTISFKWQKKN